MAASARTTSSFPYLVAASSPAAHRHGASHRIRASVGEAAMDVVSEAELREKGFMGMRKTKLVCTVGPACVEALPALARGGMGVARVNLCHGGREWHRAAMRAVRRLNEEDGFCVSLMVDTEGSQLLVADHGGATSVKAEVGWSPLLCICIASHDLIQLLHCVIKVPRTTSDHDRDLVSSTAYTISVLSLLLLTYDYVVVQ